MEANPKILLAIENAIAASRWRIAARFEARPQAERYRAHSRQRSAAATVLLNEVAAAGAREETHANRRLTTDRTRGGYDPGQL